MELRPFFPGSIMPAAQPNRSAASSEIKLATCSARPFMEVLELAGLFSRSPRATKPKPPIHSHAEVTVPIPKRGYFRTNQAISTAPHQVEARGDTAPFLSSRNRQIGIR